MKTTLIAYHGKKEIKKEYLTRVKAHAKADELVRGMYWEDGKGCAVGCTIHGNEHARYETELGIPRILARLEDRLFEGMTLAKSKTWPANFLSSIKVGADLSLVWPKFAVWMLTAPAWGVCRFAKGDQLKAINDVANGYERLIAGNPPTVEAWRTLRDAADAAYAAADAAYAADAADAAYAAAAAAAAAAYAADAYTAYAAYAAYADAAYAADAYAAYADAAYTADARRTQYDVMADKLIELLKEAK